VFAWYGPYGAHDPKNIASAEANRPRYQIELGVRILIEV